MSESFNPNKSQIGNKALVAFLNNEITGDLNEVGSVEFE
jgi:hypothetical protein